MDCGLYDSDVFDCSIGIWWQFDDDNITQISDFTKRGLLWRDSQTYEKGKKLSTDSLFVVYIKIIHLTKHSSNFSIIHNHVKNDSYEEIN